MMKLILKSILVISVILSGGVCFADFDKGMVAYNAGDYKTALKEFTVSAKQGQASAQNNLGLMYDDGSGVVQDYKESIKWYRKSADQGYSFAQYNLGVVYDNGRGVVQDYKEAVKWYKKSTDQGNSLAENNLGAMYADGRGVVQDYIKAHMYYNLAASKGNKMAKNNRKELANKMTTAQISKAQEMAVKWQEGHKK